MTDPTTEGLAGGSFGRPVTDPTTESLAGGSFGPLVTDPSMESLVGRARFTESDPSGQAVVP